MKAKISMPALLLSIFFGFFQLTVAQCVSSFATDKNRFEICKTELCFIFRSEKPYVFIPKELNETNDQEPFPCVDFNKRWPGLKGVFFDMIAENKTLHSAQCVFAGTNCTFDGMVSFVNKSSSINTHQWISAGILFVLEKRLLPGVIPSTPILEDRVHVIGPPTESQESFNDSLSLILKPLTTEAWIVVLFVLTLFGIVRVFMIYRFGNTTTYLGFFRTFFLFNFQHDIRARETHQDDWWRILNKHWSLAFIIFSTIMVLLYEVALAVIVFDAVRDPTLNEFKAFEFAIYADTTEEHFFRKMVGGNETYAKFNSLDDVYSAIEKNHTLKYTVSYAIDNRYMFTKDPKLCKKMRLYDTVSLKTQNKPPSISGVWFYSNRIPKMKRDRVDKVILNYKERGQVTKFIDKHVGKDELSPTCKPGSTQLGVFILLILLGFPTLYLITIFMAVGIATWGCVGSSSESIDLESPLDSDPEIRAVQSILADDSSISADTHEENLSTGFTETRRRSAR